MIRTTVAVVVLVLASARAALAWDPFLDAADAGPAPAPAPTPIGLYLVTQVYAGDVVTTSGATTTYGTRTIADTPGTYARILATVGTGQASALDGASLNGRARLADGRSVAGTYYEDFVRTPNGFVPVNIVFFQDDAVTRASASPAAASAAPTWAPTARPAIAAAPTPAPTRAPTPAPRRAPSAAPPAPARVRATAGVSLAPGGPLLATIEVLRGRPLELWPRVVVNGRPGSVASWTLTDAGGATVTRASGDGTVPCGATWLALPPPGRTLTITFAVTSAAAPGRVLIASLRVSVRSPALVR